MRLDQELQNQVMGWVKFIYKVIDGDDIEYDIIDEYEKPKQREPVPINYYIDYDNEKLYIISLMDKLIK